MAAAWCFASAALVLGAVVVARRRQRDKSVSQRKQPEEPSQLQAPPPHKIVFLGGSCNPTTWRKDHLVPLLEELGVSYYNPQIDEWYPELIAIEREAKDNAKIHFFVVNNQTRGMASMIEVAELVSRAFFQNNGVHVLVMIDDVPTDAHEICGEQLTTAAIKDLNRARMYLREIVHLHGGRLFDNLDAAMAGLRRICQELGYI
jgi:hypothetical protein